MAEEIVDSRILILFAHPMIHRSNVNKAMIDAVSDLEKVTAHDLYAAYPDLHIDIAYEQDLLLSNDIIIFHYPFYWYAAPAILKIWQDLVLQYGFAYGKKGTALAGKRFMNVITAGYAKSSYEEEAMHHHTVQELLRPIEQMAHFTSMCYMPPEIVYGTHRIQESEVMDHAEAYRALQNGLPEGNQ
ncbi:MAG: NAD(P)H-dependent oxidoreductase, partial [Ostreibacterium sp.]